MKFYKRFGSPVRQPAACSDISVLSPSRLLWLLCALLVVLMLESCRSTSDALQQKVDNSDEDAIERFIANAPIKEKSSVTPTLATNLESPGLALPNVDPTLIMGDLYISGSTNSASLNRRMYERFVVDGYSGSFKIEDIGTQKGFQAFCHEDPTVPLADITAASRPIQQEELDACLQIGRTPLAFWVAMDALVVVVHPDNHFVNDLSLDELSKLLRSKRWSDLQPEWPQRKILPVLPGVGLSNFDYIAEVLFAGDSRLLQTIPNAIFPQDDEEAVQQIQENGDAISIISYDSYLLNSKRLRLVTIHGVTPNTNSVQTGDWPFSRPLLLYSTAELLQSKPQLSAYLTYYLTHINEEVLGVGKFPVTRAMLDHAKVNLLVGTANTGWLDDLQEAAAKGN